MNVRIPVPAMILFIALFACNSNQSSTTENKEGAPTADSVKKDPKHISILSDEGLNLIDSTSSIETISEGYKWSEGPVYKSDSDYLLFSDVPANKVFKWKEGSGTSLYLEPSGYTGTIPKEKEPGSNGLTIDKNSKLVLCQQGNRQIARMKSDLSDPKPVFEKIVSDYKGKKFNSPNDLVFAMNGDLYFTDPPYGLKDGIRDSTKELPFQGVFCFKKNGKLLLVSDKISYPNGIALSPDNKILYISNSDSENKEWHRFDLDGNGMPLKDTVFYRVSAEEGKVPGSPDGMKVSKQGNIFATGPGGVWIFNPAGKPVARIYTGQLTSNCWIDEVQHMLYMTCNSMVMRVRLKSM